VTKGMTQSELSRRWGVSKQAIGAMVQRGMPMTNIKAAEEWRAARPRASKAKRQASVKPPALAVMEAKVVDGLEPVGTIEEAEAYLRTLKANMGIAERTSEQLRKAELFEDARRWLSVHAALAKQYPALHRQVVNLRKEHKVTVKCEDAQRAFTGFLMRFRNHIERMPAALSGRVAPHDPDHAFGELTRWVDGVFKVMSQVPDVTK
jgi:hypothetical protein